MLPPMKAFMDDVTILIESKSGAPLPASKRTLHLVPDEKKRKVMKRKPEKIQTFRL